MSEMRWEDLFLERQIELEMEDIKKSRHGVCRPVVQLPVLQMHIDWLLSGTTEVNLAGWWLMIDIQLMSAQLVSF